MLAADTSTSDADGGGRRIPYVPALDGLRALAVAAVLLFHGGFAWAQGGFLGVSLFFTLSGFLITSLLVAEHRSTGGVGLLRFWSRRARRLLPASFLALLLALVVTTFAVPAGQRVEAVGDVRAALLDVANWRFIIQGAQYADLLRVPSPVQHYWSLSIEEQFYLVFPLVAAVALRRRPRALAAFFVAVVAVAVWRQVTLDDVQRVYYGTETRAAELAIGGLLALGHREIGALAAVRRGRLADLLGGAALIATLVLWWGTDLQSSALYHGGLAAVAVVSAALIFGAVHGTAMRRVLSFAPLVGLGLISYGVYVFHFPLFLALTQDRVHVGGWWLFLIRVAATLALAVASYKLLERPVRAGAALRGRWAPIGAAAGFVAVLAVSIPVAHHRPAPASVAAGGTGSGRPPRVVVVGDSTAEANGIGLQQWGADTGRLAVSTVSSSGCGPLPGTRLRVRDGYEFVPEGCDTLYAHAVDEARVAHADAFVVFIGSAQLADWQYPGGKGWHALGEPIVDEAYRTALDRDLAVLEQAGIPILFADVPTPSWDLAVFAKLQGIAVPGSGPVALNDPARTTRLNQLDAAVIAAHPAVAPVPYAEHLESPDGTVPTAIRPDGLHLSVAGVATIAQGFLYDDLQAAYRAVVDRHPPGLAPATPNAWSP